MDERTPLLGREPRPRGPLPSFIALQEQRRVGLNWTLLKRLWGLLLLARAYPAGLLLALSVAEAYVVSRIGAVVGQLYSVFVDGDAARFGAVAAASAALYLLSSLLFCLKTWLSESLAWKWRGRLTRHAQLLYARASFLHGSPIDVDHPDQRIAQDLPQFCNVLAQVRGAPCTRDRGRCQPARRSCLAPSASPCLR